ncbi:OCTN [Mytilus edulis]|uniref:SLC22A4_5 n=1 Tax=Mytilus edulis TaxID=6550 RepID=A0A8S3QQV4_MYTED|nr:OCTN [Mytilus edulis]
MNYDKLLMKIGGFGRFQKRMLALLMIPPFLDPMTSYMLTFILGDHKHRCQMPNTMGDPFNSTLNMAANISECFVYQNGSTTACNEWVYDQSQLGRRPVLTTSLIGMMLPNLIRSFVSSLPLVGFLIFANGYFSMLVYQSGYVLATELVDPSKRVFANFAYYFSFCIGEYVLVIVAYFIRDWRILGWSTSIVVGIFLTSLLFQKESPRWLIAKRKLSRAEMILKDIAKENNANFDIDIQKIKVDETQERVAFCTAVGELFKSKVLTVRLAIFMFNWFSISMTYFGITMKVGNLGGDVYVNYLISTSAEVIALFICLYVVERLGRKKIFSASMLICGIGCLCTIFSSLYGGPSLHWLTITLAMIGKLTITVAYFNIYLMVAENFPTNLRSFAIGICSSSGYAGSMVSAYVGDLGVLVDTKFGVALPLVIFGAFGICAGLLSFALPETKNMPLPQSIQEAENISRKQYKDGGSVLYRNGAEICLFQKESARWLIAKGKLSRAEMILKDIAKENNANFDIDIQKIKVDEKHEKVAFCTVVGELFKSKILTFRLAIFMFNCPTLVDDNFGYDRKAHNNSAYFNIYLMVADYSPTNLRSFALGIGSSAGYAGSMVSAYVGDLGVMVDTKVGVALPLVIFGAFGICAGLLSFALPETKKYVIASKYPRSGKYFKVCI